VAARIINLLQYSLSPSNFEDILTAVLAKTDRCKETGPFDQTAGLLLATFNNYPPLQPVAIEMLCSAVLTKRLSSLGAQWAR
jgi:hypothetical protein